ncbi:MAG TPA: hypothetical protein PLV92_19160, partial [Pirellulaceae bacterium]|nr:hypothetical protein [Pirellulaceae bacterium]
TAEAERRRVTAIASDPQQVLDAQATTQVLQADGVRLVSDGRLADAIEVLTEAHGIAARAGIKNTYVLPSLVWLATANRLAAQRVGASASNANEPPSRDLLPKDVDRATLLQRAARAAAQATRIARTFQNDLPHALREQGLVAGLQGRDAATRAALNESLAVAERQHARYEQALTLLARGRLGRKLGWADAASDLQSGDELLRSLTGSPDVVSFAETLSDCS